MAAGYIASVRVTSESAVGLSCILQELCHEAPSLLQDATIVTSLEQARQRHACMIVLFIMYWTHAAGASCCTGGGGPVLDRQHRLVLFSLIAVHAIACHQV